MQAHSLINSLSAALLQHNENENDILYGHYTVITIDKFLKIIYTVVHFFQILHPF